MTLTEIFPYLVHQFQTEHQLVTAIEELSRKFTTQRDSITDYLKDERLSSAYTAFYLSTNVPKLEAAFRWLPEKFLEELRSATLIDVGAGPGTFSLALRRWLGQPLKRVVQLETSAVMRTQARKLWEGLYPAEEVSVWERAQEKVPGPAVMIFGHSANEMGPEKVLSYIDYFQADHVLFIEPGTKDFFSQMLIIRERLLEQHFNVLFPCPTAESCPLRSSTQDWCHQFLQVRHDPEVERLTQLVRKDRRLLPIIFHAYSKSFHTQLLQQRIIRVLPETKFSFEWEICDHNQLERVQLMKRGLKREEEKEISALLAGTGVELEVEKKLEQSKRVKLRRINN